MIKERPIIFSGEMVRAILDGRKTQTRRVIKNIGGASEFLTIEKDIVSAQEMLTRRPANSAFILPHCPYGKPGDRLWVRENFWIEHDWDTREYAPAFDCGINLKEDDWAQVWYCADQYEPTLDEAGYPLFYSKRPSIHMPRWASRIDLEVIGVRVERIQDISPDDAWSEGIEYRGPGDQIPMLNALEDFSGLWDSINAKRGYSWESNPWVWVIEFKEIDSGKLQENV